METFDVDSPPAREVWYLAHPVRTPAREGWTIQDNLANAKAWLRWFFLNDPERVYIAPWIAEVEAMTEFAEAPEIVTKALRDDVEIVSRCNGVVLTGGRVTEGMDIERAAAARVRDLSEYVSPQDLEEAQGLRTLAVEQ